MHELSIALSILDLMEEESQRRDGAHIAAVHLKLGPLSGVVKDALLAAYGLARDGTEFADCNMVIREVPVIVYCPRCLAEREVESIQLMRCAECGELAQDVRSGRELEIAAMEICQ